MLRTRSGTKLKLKFTPLEFETDDLARFGFRSNELKFTPLEFETLFAVKQQSLNLLLKFTPLEFETSGFHRLLLDVDDVKIYSVGV